MVQLTEVLDEEFVREQEGPHDEDDWDTDSGTYSFILQKASINVLTPPNRVRRRIHRLCAQRRNPL